jgi:hypothetical protein
VDKLGFIGDVVDLLGIVMGIAGNNLPPGTEVLGMEQVRIEADAHLKKVFEEINKSMANLLARLFGDKNINYSLSELFDGMKRVGYKPVADDWDPTAIIMSMG